MRTIFLSDAHLRDPGDENYRRLLDFLNRQEDLDALFLLGDIFEFWLGYRHVVFANYVPLLETLQRLTDNGTRLFFVEGNHDFNLGLYFSERLNCTVIPEQLLLEWDSQQILVCHGDLLNPDPRYRRLRAFWRSWPVRALARVIHPDLVWAFAIWLSNKSHKHKPDNNHQDPTPQLQKFSEQQDHAACRVIICGHYHHPVETVHHEIKLIALGDWINQFSYAEMQNGEITLKTLRV